MIFTGLSFDLTRLEMSLMKTTNANLLLHGFSRLSLVDHVIFLALVKGYIPFPRCNFLNDFLLLKIKFCYVQISQNVKVSTQGAHNFVE